MELVHLVYLRVDIQMRHKRLKKEVKIGIHYDVKLHFVNC